MIGGRVIHIDHLIPVRLWVCQPGEGEMCVHVEDDRDTGLPALGQEVWWQSGRVMFGGPDPKHGEVSLRKIGNSHSPEACRLASPRTEGEGDGVR